MSEPRIEPHLREGAPADAEATAEPRQATGGQRHHGRVKAILIALIALLAIAALFSVFWQPDRRLAVAPERAPAPPAAPAPTTEALPRHPIAATPAELPPLDTSDAVVLAALATVFADGSFEFFVERDRIVRRIVATIDNLPRRSAPPAQWPMKPAPGALAAVARGGRITLADTNGIRYAPYVRLLEAADTQRIVDFYRRHYPLFQQAYRELGYPAGNFNDRAVEAIDSLIATPTPPEPLVLTQPKVFLQYADPAVEALPAGQKLMLRIGPDNAARVKAKLAELRAAITAGSAAGAR